MAYVELHEHTEQSLLDGLPRASEAVARAVENGNPALAITDHGTCFPEGTRIRMADGSERPIEEVRLRDWVLTAEGRQGQVRRLMTREAPALLRLVLWGHKHLVATPDHPVLTKRGYVPIGALTGDDWVRMPRFMPGIVAAVRTEDLVRQPSHRLSASRRFAPSPTTGAVVRADAKPLPEKIDLTLDAGRLIGLFLAEGSCDESRVVWTFNIDERDTLAAEVMRILTDVFALEPRLVMKPKKHVANVVLFGRNWSRLFSALCGTGAGYKRLLPVLCGGPTDFLDGVMSGWLAGDGHHRRGVTTGTTISPDLALGMFDIAMGLGYAPSITRQPARRNRQPRWDVTIPIAVANSYRLRQEESCIWRRVRSVEEVPEGNGAAVYNLSVAGDESYVAEGISVHNCAGHIEFQRECLAAGIDPIFGIETYFQPDRLVRPADVKGQRARLKELADARGDLLMTPEARSLSAQVKAAEAAQGALRGGRHLILLAQGERGLRDLWAASTEASATGYYWKPRMDWALLEERGSDLIATTACLGGIISQDLMAGLRDRAALDRALADLDRLKATFPGRLYLEMQANELPEQIRLNKLLAELSAAFGLPLVAACDAHYLTPEDAPLHREWMLCQTGGGKEDYWHFSPMLPEDAVRASLGYLDPKVVDAAVRNTVEVASRCTARIDWHVPPPVFTPGGTPDDDARRLRALCDAALSRIGPTRVRQDRLDYEFPVVADKGFAGCYLIVEELVSYVRSQGVLVGPGRGSAAGSFISYLTGITSIDPIETGLMFERFLTPGRASMPDFDLDFPTSKRPMIQDHVMDRYGADHVVRVGTVLRYQSKGILNKLSSVHAWELPDDAPAHFKEIAGLIDEAEAGTAGLGLPWDEILTEPRIAAYAQKYPKIFATATALHGRVHAVGQHPAGLIISPQIPLAGQLPMRREEGGKSMLVSQWDYRAADELGLLKLDNLTLRNLDSVQRAIDLVEARTGIRLDPWSWSGQYGDPQVFEEISGGHTLGMFQLETSLCRQYCVQMQPGSLADLADLTTFVRPGPRNSGATAKYLLRRAGREEVSYPHPLLEETLAETHGVLLYQEQVMNACKALAGYDDLEADGVRKILGKKLTSKVAAAGEEFVRRAVGRGHDEEQMSALWADMAEFGKYAFNKCTTGDTLIHLAASSQNSHGETDLASLHRRLHAPLLPAIRGRTKTGDEYRGPCVACGGNDSPRQWIRGLCSTCYVWRQKFHDPNRGLHGLSYWADGRIRPARIIDVVAQGERETWKLTLKDGKSITATGNHRHLTDAGYRRVDELRPGDRLIIDGGYEVSQYEPARHRLTRGDRRAEGRINGVFGEENYAFIDGGAAFWKRWKQTHPKVCAQCGADQGRIELAHLDGDHANNVDGNLAWLCASCHKAYDYEHNNRPRRWQKGHRSESVPIESIEYAGLQETYDVVMDSPHNFVANGIVTHNSHGYSYGVLSYWTAWMKVHYPVEMLTGILSTLDKMDRMAEFAIEARRIGISVLPPDARFSGAEFAADGMSIRYGLTSIHGVGPQAIGKITAGQPYAAYDDFARRSGVNSGVLAALARAGALDSMVPSRRGLVRVIESDKDGSSVRCVHKNPEACGPNGLPCDYDWDGEPPPPPRYGAGGRELKVLVKPPPKRCTVACRRYTPPSLPGMDGWGEYPPDALFRQDMETYGTWMSEAPFERLEQLGAGMRERARRMALAVAEAPEGSYPMTGIMAEWHRATTKRGGAMWWVKIVTEVSVMDLACFSPLRESEPDAPAQLRSIRPGALVAAEVVKRSYMSGGGFRMGWRLSDIWSLG